MAVEYEISSDVATITGVASNTQVANIVKFYTGSITYDDEPTSKYASVTINGKTQRVMLCVAVSGTVNYDDVPCLYSTVSGHRALNVVEPTETGTPDDVPSLYETVVVDGKTVRALRCVLINQTPNYDGVSSTCTFTDNGKTHTAQLVNKIVGGSIEVIVKGVSPLTLPDAIADSLSYVKAFGGTEQRNLPDNYIERQFIYMMDGSYLLTDIVPTFAGHYELDMQTTSVTGAAATYLGGRDESSGNGGLRFAHITNKTFRIFGFGDYSTSPGVAADNTKYKFIWDNGSFWVYSGTTLIYSGTFTEETMPTTTPLAINGWNSGGTIGGNIEGIYLYSFKAWNAQGELVADYVPAVQKGTVPVVGFYDTVSGTFKTATAGTFAAGGEAVPTPDAPMNIVSNNGVLKARHQSGLPLGYTLLDYIESSRTQYIDTGVYISTGYKVRVKAYATSVPITIAFFGCTTEAVATDAKKGICRLIGASINRCAWGNGNGTTISNLTGNDSPNTWYDMVCDNGVWTINDELFATCPESSFTSEYSMWLFARNTSGTVGLPASCRISVCQIWDNNGQMIRNLVPCKNASDVVGMYDLVNGVFYQNAGTGDFVAGSPVSDPVEIYADGLQETINVHTKNLFDEQWNRNTGVSTQTATWGQVVTASGWSTSGLVPVKAGQQYTVSYNTTTQIYVFYYESDGTMQSSYDTTSSTKKTFTVPSGATHIRLQVNKYTAAQIADLESQLETGATATTYEPYFDGGTATAEMLLKVGDYQDVQSIIDGVVTRNVGVKVFDGTENWSLWRNGYTTRVLRGIARARTVPLSNITESVSSKIELDGSADLNFYNIVTDFPTVTDWKRYIADQYNAGTPVIVIYPLATPTTESVAGQTLQVQDGDNTLEITQASLTGLELEAQYQAAVSLTIQEVQDANLDPNVEVTIN